MTPNSRSLLKILTWGLLALFLSVLALALDGQTLSKPDRLDNQTHSKPDRLELSLLLANASSRTLDCYSTQRMLDRGHHEILLPAAVSDHPAAMAGYSAGTVALDWWVTRRLERHNHRKLARLVTLIDLSQDAPWAIHNLFLKR